MVSPWENKSLLSLSSRRNDFKYQMRYLISTGVVPSDVRLSSVVGATGRRREAGE